MKTVKMNIITLLLTLCSLSLFAQKAPIIKGKILNNKFTQVDLKLAYKNDSISYGKATIDPNGNFILNTTITKPDLYRLTLSEKDFFLFALLPGEVIDVTFDANNLQSIVSVSGSENMTFVKNAADYMASNKRFLDSLNSGLQSDPLQVYYNTFFQDFHQFHQTNQEVDTYVSKFYNTYDTLLQVIQLYSEKGKIKSKNWDLFLSQAVPLMKNLESSFAPLKNYLNNASSYFDFKANRITNTGDFYKILDEQYLDQIDSRHQLVYNGSYVFVSELTKVILKRDSLLFNELLSDSKIKKNLVEEILKVIEKNPVNSADGQTYMSQTEQTNNAANILKEEAQKQVRAVVQKYQNFYNTENPKREQGFKKLILDNKTQLAVLMFIDMFPREQNLELHSEVIKALQSKYPDNPLVAERYTIETKPANPTAIGAMAPDLAFSNPEGKILKLSDLRGKVVLLDFWASWCRPCRMENPNVVKDYHKYHEKGFEVFSVSLDKDKNSWIKAIQDDGLVWPNHVSDLKYWSSEAAAIYGVTSIPATFLIGKDGRIIAKNLRGEALGSALEELLGK
ncbi:MAG: alkyl hydroperoxide reductase/Thiol specific antioxidant/Mal allergen [Bacteroidetes bacterium]|nr:alkyl hydroperoxide reductase/Thiol specific antioxidant/Mal allergen [Bacteroidota bacterium]